MSGVNFNKGKNQMKISDIVLSVATYLGKSGVEKYLLNGDAENATSETLMQTDVLTRLANLVINEIAGGYIPMIKKEKITVDNGKIYIADLSENALEIKNVLYNGQEVSFKIKGAYVQVFAAANEIEYSYMPHNYGLTDEIGYSEKDISSTALSFGVAAEYCLTEWRFEEAVMWRERFTDAMKKFCKIKNGKILERAWV